MTVPIDSFWLVKFKRALFCKQKLFLEEVRTLQKMLADEQAARKDIEDELLKLSNSVSVPDELSTNLAESNTF